MSLLTTPSQGKSEVLKAMSNAGRITTVKRVTQIVGSMFHSSTHDHPTFAADVLTVLQALATDGKVTPSPAAPDDKLSLTAAGHVASRAPRPRPVRIG